MSPYFIWPWAIGPGSAPARRKFVDAKKARPKGKTGRADQALVYIQKLYRVERQDKDSTAVQRHQLRQEQAAPIIEKLKTWLEQTTPRVPPQSTLGKALRYLDNQWPRLIRYLDDGRGFRGRSQIFEGWDRVMLARKFDFVIGGRGSKI